jgi:hypothetical protein
LLHTSSSSRITIKQQQRYQNIMTMLTYAQLLATLLLLIMSNSGGAAAAAQEQAGPACNVCGAEGLQVGSPDTIIELGDLLPLLLPTSMTCGELQTAGEASLISVEQCLDLPNLSTACNCQEEQAPPVAPPVGCSVCGPGLRVGDPDALFESQGQPAVPCGILQEAGDFNWISEEQCSSFWADQINAICSCQEAGDEAIPDPANPSNECKACPEGYKVVNPGHAVLEGPVDNVLCGDLDDNVEGIYATDTCNLLSYFVNTACGGCMLEDDGGDAASPTVSPKRGRYHNDSLFERGYSLYIIIAAASLMVFFLGCLLYSKYVGEDGPVGPSNFTPGLAAALANANAEAEEQAKFEEEAKYRSMVLDALFPEQKVRTTISIFEYECTSCAYHNVWLTACAFQCPLV